MVSRWLAGLAIPFFGLGCAEHPRCADLSDLPRSDSVLLIGDSAFDFHADTCSDVGDHVSFARGEQIDDRAVGGTRLVHPSEEDITSSYSAGEREWMIVAGGANDLMDVCSCACGPEVLDGLVGADLVEGAMPALVRRAVDDGAKVIVFGYYEPVGDSEFEDCGDELEVMNSRYAELAAADSAIEFVDGRDVFSPNDVPEAYAADGIHPSALGSERIAEAILGVMDGG